MDFLTRVRRRGPELIIGGTALLFMIDSGRFSGGNPTATTTTGTIIYYISYWGTSWLTWSVLIGYPLAQLGRAVERGVRTYAYREPNSGTTQTTSTKHWKWFIITYLLLQFSAQAGVTDEGSIDFSRESFFSAIGLMAVPLAVSSLVGWFTKIFSDSTLDWKSFSVTYLLISFIGFSGIERAATEVNPLAAMVAVAETMIPMLMTGALVGWLVRRHSRTEA